MKNIVVLTGAGVSADKTKFIIDPKMPKFPYLPNCQLIEKVASKGMKIVRDILLEEFYLKM